MMAWSRDERVRSYLTPGRIVWESTGAQAWVENGDILLETRSGQISLNVGTACVLHNEGGQAGILLDFGLELQGGVQILTWFCGKSHSTRIRVRFGESAGEAMSEIGEKGSTNDHAIRDFTTEASFLGMAEIGNTGFRFVRIDLLEDPGILEIKSVRAVRLQEERTYAGSFSCSDPLLDQIWQTGAYTVELNMQHYLWDGIKRDRLVWIGDMYPETSAVQAVFGYDAAVPRSLDFIRDETPLPQWMNGIPSYSMWWVLIHRDWYWQNGDLAYLDSQRTYLLPLLSQLASLAGADGMVMATPNFVDWSAADNEPAKTATLHSVLVLALRAGADLCAVLAENAAAAGSLAAADRILLTRGKHDAGGSKQAAALLALSGLADLTATNREILAADGAHGLSAFLGYFVLQARAAAGDVTGGLEMIRAYWGGMLKMGATTFWEEFDIDWMANAARIDELASPGQADIHGDNGKHCYIGYRKSLCHGWAAGPTPWLAEHVLGIKVLAPGCRLVRVKPDLGDLAWAEGVWPTPFGPLKVRHERMPDGQIASSIQAPEGVMITGA